MAHLLLQHPSSRTWPLLGSQLHPCEVLPLTVTALCALAEAGFSEMFLTSVLPSWLSQPRPHTLPRHLQLLYLSPRSGESQMSVLSSYCRSVSLRVLLVPQQALCPLLADRSQLALGFLTDCVNGWLKWEVGWIDSGGIVLVAFLESFINF